MIKKVYICSPLGGNVEENIEKAKQYAKYALLCGTAPVVPHFYALCLDDNKTFTPYGLMTNKGELLFYTVSPTNISVLSSANIEIKVRHLMMVLSAIPDIEINCTDSSECFDDNKAYLHKGIEEENNPKVKALLKKDMEFLDHIQIEMATARQFLFIARCKNMKQEQVFNMANRVEKVITEQGFEVRRMKKEDVKRFLAIYFDASMNGELMPDTDGEQFSAFIDKDSVERVK